MNVVWEQMGIDLTWNIGCFAVQRIKFQAIVTVKEAFRDFEFQEEIRKISESRRCLFSSYNT